MDYVAISAGVLLLATGLPRVIAPHRSLGRSQQDRAERIAEIEAGALERFFEEHRALKAYPVTSSRRKWVILGWLAAVSGLAMIATGIIGKTATLALFG